MDKIELKNKINELLLIIIFLIIGWYSSNGVKSQLIRLLDILLYGPFLILLSFKMENIIIKIILLFIGSTTISYNLKNYIYY